MFTNTEDQTKLPENMTMAERTHKTDYSVASATRTTSFPELNPDAPVSLDAIDAERYRALRTEFLADSLEEHVIPLTIEEFDAESDELVAKQKAIAK
jgi:hypothetical protein